jgi:protein SCO1/2
LLSFSIILLACAGEEKSLPYFNTPEFTPLFIKTKAEAEKEVTHAIGEFSFQNQYGKTITDYSITNKIHVANFIFTSCGSICPVMTDHMKLVNKVFGNDSSVMMLSFSVTPWIDDVPTLKAYAERNNIASNNWHLLTGKKSEIYTLARQSYFAEEDLGFTKDSSEFLHTEHFILVDRDKRIRGIYNGTLPLDMRQLIEDIQWLKREE